MEQFAFIQEEVIGGEMSHFAVRSSPGAEGIEGMLLEWRLHGGGDSARVSGQNGWLYQKAVIRSSSIDARNLANVLIGDLKCRIEAQLQSCVKKWKLAVSLKVDALR
jgi:hypothetical protein